jgi:hypothetical protein
MVPYMVKKLEKRITHADAIATSTVPTEPTIAASVR